MCEYAEQLPGRILCIITKDNEHYHVYRPAELPPEPTNELLHFAAMIATTMCVLGIIVIGAALTAAYYGN